MTRHRTPIAKAAARLHDIRTGRIPADRAAYQRAHDEYEALTRAAYDNRPDRVLA